MLACRMGSHLHHNVNTSVFTSVQIVSEPRYTATITFNFTNSLVSM